MEKEIHDILQTTLAVLDTPRSLMDEDEEDIKKRHDFIIRSLPSMWYMYKHGDWFLGGRDFENFKWVQDEVKETLESVPTQLSWPIDPAPGRNATHCSRDGVTKQILKIQETDCTATDNCKTTLKCAFCKDPYSGTHFHDHHDPNTYENLGCRFVQPEGMPMTCTHQMDIVLNEMMLVPRVEQFAQQVKTLSLTAPRDAGKPHYPVDSGSWRCDARDAPLNGYKCTNAHTQHEMDVNVTKSDAF
tara:strand:- start:179 stop:910 length:732 start_codon:yes stop_codon:yes gene_type:complete